MRIRRSFVGWIKLKNGKLRLCEWEGPEDRVDDDRVIGYTTKDQDELVSAFERRSRSPQAMGDGPAAQQKTKPGFTTNHIQGQESTTRQRKINLPLQERRAAVNDGSERLVEISLDDDQLQVKARSVKKPLSSECHPLSAVFPGGENAQLMHWRHGATFEAIHVERLLSSAGPSYANRSSQLLRLNHDAGTEQRKSMASTAKPQQIKGPHRCRCAQVPELERLMLTILNLRGDHNALLSIDRSGRDIVRQYMYEQIFDADDGSSRLSRDNSKGLVDVAGAQSHRPHASLQHAYLADTERQHHDGGYVSTDRAPPPDLKFGSGDRD
ncbi:MAG: hypothetical protein L6R38_007456 [Xanthoria sp. 2 TBL-2021]|nr:MAG: hypothetical protein L6R38_007456 [Xanthoria sp. 2 TBL-2021]